MKTVAIDLDGVLHQYQGWQGVEHFDPPYPGAENFLKRLRAEGYSPVVFSTRPPDLVKAWLQAHKLWGLVDGVTSTKPPAVAYVDDRAIRFNGDYDQVLEDLALSPWWMQGGGKDASL